MNIRRERVLLFLTLFLFGVTCIVWYSLFSNHTNKLLTVSFLNVGQGDAIFIEAPGGNQVLVDSGPGKSILRELGHVMPFYDRSIDIILSTHPDKDHIGGFPAVLDRYDVSYVLKTSAESDTGIFHALEEKIKAEEGAQTVSTRRGQVISIGGGAYLKILFPSHDVSAVSSNDASVVLQVVYGDTSFILTGDAPQKIEEYLVSIDGENLKSDVLKAGHHGSKTSSSAAFLSLVSAPFSIISAGENNSYGHPHEEVLMRLSQNKSKILYTYEKSPVTFISDGETVVLK